MKSRKIIVWLSLMCWSQREETFCTSLYRKTHFQWTFILISKVLLPFRIRKDYHLYPSFTEHLFFVATGTKFHPEGLFFKRVLFGKIYFPGHFMDRCIMIFLDKIFIVKEVITTVPRKEVRICLPFLGKHSFEIRTKLCKFVSLPFSAM